MNAPVYAFCDDEAKLLWIREETSADAPETTTSWQVVHAHVEALGKERAKHERAICRWLLAADRLGVHRYTAHGSLAAYVRALTGLRPRQVEERLRVGRALALLPAIDGALSAGDICFSA